MACLAIAGLATPALSDDHADASPVLGLALNTVSATEAGGCRLSFVIRNDLGADIESLVAEAVLFDVAGRVAVMTLFDFGSLPEGRPRVRQFDLAGQPVTDWAKCWSTASAPARGGACRLQLVLRGCGCRATRISR